MKNMENGWNNMIMLKNMVDEAYSATVERVDEHREEEGWIECHSKLMNAWFDMNNTISDKYFKGELDDIESEDIKREIPKCLDKLKEIDGIF